MENVIIGAELQKEAEWVDHAAGITGPPLRADSIVRFAFLRYVGVYTYIVALDFTSIALIHQLLHPTNRWGSKLNQPYCNRRDAVLTFLSSDVGFVPNSNIDRMPA